MLPRTLAPHLRTLARGHPVLAVLGPRQSGKTTLCRKVFSKKPYASLEDPDIRQLALSDPRGFLSQYPDGAVLDEIQRVPELASYLQGIVDARKKPGQFVLTGSENFSLTQGISQSLAGRVALVTLLPLSFEEAKRSKRAGGDLFSTLFTGGYPALYDREVTPTGWLANYVRTYVERDVRQVLNVGDLLSFQTFFRLCAGHSGQLLNLSTLGASAGITHNTAKAWLSVLEASYLVHRLPPWVANLNKRLVKTPKLHFFDTGLLCYLLGIRSKDELLTHPQRGAIFESWVVSEIYKAHANQGIEPRLSFFRDKTGTEVDLLVQAGSNLLAIEIKSGQTVAADFFDALERFQTLLGTPSIAPFLVYGGSRSQARTTVQVLAWSDLNKVDWMTGKPGAGARKKTRVRKRKTR